jgi:hypothetical protein
MDEIEDIVFHAVSVDSRTNYHVPNCPVYKPLPKLLVMGISIKGKLLPMSLTRSICEEYTLASYKGSIVTDRKPISEELNRMKTCVANFHTIPWAKEHYFLSMSKSDVNNSLVALVLPHVNPLHLAVRRPIHYIVNPNHTDHVSTIISETIKAYLAKTGRVRKPRLGRLISKYEDIIKQMITEHQITEVTVDKRIEVNKFLRNKGYSKRVIRKIQKGIRVNGNTE